MRLIGALLLLVAVVGLYARQSEAVGALGLTSFLAALIGTGLLVGTFQTNAFFPTASRRGLWPLGSSYRPQYSA